MDTTYVKEQAESRIPGETGAPATHDRIGSASPPRADSILSGTVALLLFTGLQRGVGFIRQLALCKLLRSEVLGQWDMAFGFLSLAMPLTVVGIPASLGRYVEHFRKRGQLADLLNVTFSATMGLGLIAAILIVVFRDAFSRLIFGGNGHESLVVLVAIALFVMILFSYMTRFFVALRLQRVTSLLTFIYGITFTVSCILMAMKWASATTVVLTHLSSLAVCCCIGGYFAWRTWQDCPAQDPSGEVSNIWSKLLSYSVSMWILSGLLGILAMVDRYMLLHYSGDDVPLELVGQFYVARIIPMLMTSVATMFGALLLPYMSRLWEAGDYLHVAKRLDLFVRASGLCGFVLAAFFLSSIPTIFQWGFGDKFELGLAVLGFTLAWAVAHGTCCVVRLYLLCDESVWLVNLVVIVTIAFNIGMNLILLPRFGLYGVALAGYASAFTMLLGILCIARTRGMRPNFATLGIAALPSSLLMGPVVAMVILVVVLLLVAVSPLLFDAAEKSEARRLAMRLIYGLGTR